MTITTNPARDEYTSSAAQTVFNYTFKIYESTDLNVYVTPVGQTADDATDITTAYTVDPATIGDDAGGFITFTSPLNSGDLVTIVSDIPTDRTVDYQTNGDFSPDTVNNDIDRTVSLVKQVENLATRTVQFQESQQSATGITLPAPSAGDLLIWNGTGTGFDNDDGTSLAGIAAAAAACAADAASTAADVVTTNADVVTTNADALTTTTLTDEFNDIYYGALASDPATAPSGAASTAGDLYFNTTLDVMYEYTGAVWQDIAVGALADGSVTTPKIADGAVTLAKLNSDVSLSTSSGSRNQVLNQDPMSQGLSQRVGMSSTLYTGTGASNAVATGVDMATGDLGGLVWVKCRSNTYNNILTDTVRGLSGQLISDTTAAEASSPTNYDSFDSTGFTLGTSTNTNANTETYVAWSFQTTDKFTGTTNRNKAYTAHYNAEMGFSIVGFEGDGVAGHEIPHHLGRTPELSIFKTRDAAVAWMAKSPLFDGPNDYVLPNTSAAIANNALYNTLFNDDTVKIGAGTNLNQSAIDLISYHFATIEGVSKVGTYIGTGAAGNYVDCDFGDKSAGFVLVKNLSSAQNWIILDASRSAFDNGLFPNLSNAESSGWLVEGVNGGFVISTTNATLNTLNDEYLFLAFADNSGTTGQSQYDYPTTDDVLTIEQDTLISGADGFSASGETNVQENVPAATTMTFGAGFEDAKYYVYKDIGGSYGTTVYRPLEEQDYSGVQTPNQDDVNLRTTAKHFDYESSTGVASASGELASLYAAWLAFSKVDIGTYEEDGWIVTSTTTSWLQYKYAEPRVLKSWRMKESNTGTRLPKRFDIEGSNDGFTWTVIDSTYNASDYTGNGVRLWGDLQSTSGNTTSYIYHRINITANSGDATYTSIAELEFNTETPSDRYDVSEGVMYNYAGTAIQRVYLGELRTDTDGDIINNTIVNYTPNKLKTTDAELHGDLIVRGDISNVGVATAWVNFDGTQNPPLIRSSYNVKDVVDLGAGTYTVIFETPMDNEGYASQLSSSGDLSTDLKNSPNGDTQTVDSITIYFGQTGVANRDQSTVSLTIFGGKS